MVTLIEYTLYKRYRIISAFESDFLPLRYKSPCMSPFRKEASLWQSLLKVQLAEHVSHASLGQQHKKAEDPRTLKQLTVHMM